MNYRREIDGLRAVAVIPVILFHAGFALFSGGFVGVDVFFVISGYLITTKILTDKEAGTFSLAGFYERRARRILPALFLVLFVSVALAWSWLLPDDMKSFSASLVAVNALASNLFFFSDTRYFAPDASLRPLLHTWSLAVEEQYYLIYPFFLWAAWKLGQRRIVGLLGVAFVLSLGTAQWGSAAHPRFTFFMLHTRAWEILAGALVAFYLFPRERRDRGAASSGTPPWFQLWAALGLLLIASAVWGFDARTPSPSLYTLAPVVGTALIILFATEGTFIGRLLGSRPLVGIGLVSYSAYLWHQPLFAFSKYRSGDDPGLMALSLLAAASLGLAYLSWKYVETPFRSKRRFTRAQVFSYGAACSVALFTVGGLGYFTSGFSGRFSDKQLQVLAFSHYDYQAAYRVGVCFLDENQALPFNDICQAGASDRSTMIWGDSHAAALSVGLRRARPDVVQYTASRCLPIAGEVITDRPDCKSINDFVMGQVRRIRPRELFLHADWRRHKDQDPAGSLARTIDFVRTVSPATRIVVVGGVPQWHPSLPILLTRQNIGLDHVLYVRSSVFGDIAGLDRALEMTARANGVTFLSALRALCQEDRCQPITTLNGALTLTTWDYGHMTEGGSVMLAKKLLEDDTAAAR